MLRHDVPLIHDLRFMTCAIVASFARLLQGAVVLVIFFFITAFVLVEGASTEVQKIEEWFSVAHHVDSRHVP